ncbi:MAG: tRNA (adenosine(37)-N6)-threonylcarbamoyltransferase complex ATPase subunit type 1 TsaE [Patescibacteria group bacterium]
MKEQITKIVSNSAKQTQEIGHQLGLKLKGNETIALSGELGAGKTHLVKGLVSGLGIEANVVSPTFVLQRVYKKGNKILNHFDAYRISADEFANLGVLDWIGESVNVVEWGEIVRDVLPTDTIWITMTVLDENKREILIKTDEEHSYLPN